MNFILLFLLASLTAFGAVTNAQVVGVSRQQIIVSFDVLDPQQCAVSAFEDPAGTITVEDTGLFLANCNRAGNVITGTRVTAVVGLRNVATASDGKLHSRSLKVQTPYYLKIDDFTDSTFIVVQATTNNIPWGDTHPEQPLYNATAFGHWAYPDLDWSDAGVNKWYTDPLSGVPFRRVPRDEMGGGGLYDNNVFERFATIAAFDVTKEASGTAKWTNIQNAVNRSTLGPFASYSGNGSDPLFVALDRVGQNTPYEIYHGWEDLQMHLYGSAPACTGADCNISFCLVTKYNPTASACTSPVQQITLTNTPAQYDFPSTYPQYSFAGWNLGRIMTTDEAGVWGSRNSGGNPANAVVTNSTVALSIGSDGDTLLPLWAAPGMKMLVGSSAYTLGASATAATFPIQETGVNASAQWMLANTGFLIWKTNTNANPINIAADFSIATTRAPQIASYSEKDWCSKLDFPLSVAADGTTAIPTKRARMCQVGEYGSVTQYLLVADDGEIRYISPLAKTNVHVPMGTFSSADPFTFYTFGDDDTNSTYRALYTAVYTPGNGCNYRTWTGNKYGTVTPPNDCVVWTNVTPASSGRSVTEQIAAVMTSSPIWDSTWNASKLCGLSAGDAGAICFNLWGIGGHFANFSMGPQDGVTFFANVDLNTGLLTKFFDSFSDSLSGLRWSGVHSGGSTDGDKWQKLDTKSLYGAGFPYLTGPWVLNPVAITQKSTDGITYVNDTSTTANSPYGYSCGSNPQGIVGQQCEWFHVTTDEVCDMGSDTAGAFSTEVTRWPCSWHSGWTAGPNRLKVDDYYTKINGTSVDGKSEKHRILTKTSDGSGGYYLMVQRHATCDNPSGDLNGTPPGVLYFRAVDGQTPFPNGWQMTMMPSQACDADATWYDASTPLASSAVAKWVSLPMQHSGFGIAPDGFQMTEAGGGLYRTALFKDLQGTSAHKTQNTNDVAWNGRNNGGSNSTMEQYTAVTNWSAVTQLARSHSFEARHMNPEGGAYPEKNGISIYPHSYFLQNGTQYVYKTDVYGQGQDQKQWRATTSATTGHWLDISSPTLGNTITDNTPWSTCQAYHAGECRVGSLVGDYFVWAKNMWIEKAGCVTGTLKDLSPCTYVPWPQSGWITQNNTQRDDLPGNHFRRIMMGLVGAFSAYHYSSPHMVPDHKFMFVRYSYANGISGQPLLYKLPTDPVEDNIDRSRYVSVPVTFPAGPGFRRVRFGYAENGPASSFFCTSRQEACLTDTILSPFAFASSDTSTGVNCAGGCRIDIPGLSGRVLYYSIERSPNGTSGWIAGPVQVAAVP